MKAPNPTATPSGSVAIDLPRPSPTAHCLGQAPRLPSHSKAPKPSLQSLASKLKEAPRMPPRTPVHDRVFRPAEPGMTTNDPRELRRRNCPSCGKRIMALATLCGYCWNRSCPVPLDRVDADSFPDLDTTASAGDTDEHVRAQRRPCPYCAKSIMAAATLCGYCWKHVVPAS